jgi:hypothetical protein
MQGSIPAGSFWHFHSNLSSAFAELSTLKTYHFPRKHLSRWSNFSISSAKEAGFSMERTDYASWDLATCDIKETVMPVAIYFVVIY